MFISLSQAIEPLRVYTTESVTHGQCDAKLILYLFPAAGHHRPLARTKLYWSRVAVTPRDPRTTTKYVSNC